MPKKYVTQKVQGHHGSQGFNGFQTGRGSLSPASVSIFIGQACWVFNDEAEKESTGSEPRANDARRKTKGRIRETATAYQRPITAQNEAIYYGRDGLIKPLPNGSGNILPPSLPENSPLAAGQRYSFVLTANQIVGNYWIRALAILRYAGAPKADPKTSSVITQPLVETLLHPLMPSRAPGNPYPGGAGYNIQLELGLDLPMFKFLVNRTRVAATNKPVRQQGF
ncbi:hypothetical protein B0H17DRAFT_1240558 [Mycena rosella]|uniref:Plastocyanin-like domain-containing protein n=1 Tax=Mycena rosella TaxID=1033263 RepID=A0AAD7D214_MYCRO|nr:hypothetical protein B0H17DRAFT_1240558 [Mycena rosella]